MIYWKQNFELVRAVEALAEKKGVKAGQLALAWVHAQAEISSIHLAYAF